ncbi:methyl-accepting chemotaxis protein [Rhizobacter sp. P5_C2]
MNFTHLMRQFTIRTRMIGAIAIVLALLALVGGAGLTGLLRMQSQTTAFMSSSFADSNTLASLRTSLGEMRLAEKEMIVNYEKAEEVTRFSGQWTAARERVVAQLKKLQEGTPDDSTALAKRMETELGTYATAMGPVIKQLENSGYDSATVANRVMGRAKEAIGAAEKTVGDLQKALGTEGAQAEAARQTMTRQTITLFAVALGIAILIVVPATLINMQSICRPMTEAQALAASIARGDLTNQITLSGRDESTQLMQALSNMQDSLRTLVGQVRNSTDSISTASAEIATGNQDLSARTEQTASNLQQAASSMEQLTGTVKQSADSARQANQLASSAAEVAARGGSVVSQVVTTMDEINASSKKISDIIGVIDGIAFQTNILALNAAVEAARAGEQGRGFAVVAGEVRSLAQRSAQAAKEIKALIGASVEKVDSGSRLVADAGKTMQEIVGSVQRVSDIIGEITAASSEQSDGIGQVNQSVTQLDQMTQQNAALVEESAAAAESLRDQAQRLASVIATFRLDAHGVTAAPAPAANKFTPKPVATAKPVAAKASPAKPASSPAAAAKPAPAVTKVAVAVSAAAPRPAPAPAAGPAFAATAPNDDWETF